MNLMKIALIGRPGSGKTYLSSKLSETTKIQRIDIDTLFDRHLLNLASKRVYQRSIKKLFENKESWIVNGYHGKRMPEWIWKSANLIIFIDLPKKQLTSNVVVRRHLAKKCGKSQHWQASKANNLKNFAQIKFLDNSLRNDFARISRMVKSSNIVTLNSMKQVDKYIDEFTASN